MADSSSMPNKPVTPQGTTQKTTEKGPHGGGTKYHQAKIGEGFLVQKPLTGHTQKRNIGDK